MRNEASRVETEHYDCKIIPLKTLCEPPLALALLVKDFLR